jgi:hypothetical protein
MSGMRDYTREELLQLTPEIYLAAGYVDAAGALRPEFLTDFATAAANQLVLAELSPQELALTYEGIRQILPQHDGDPAARLHAATEEALAVVARAIQQPNNEGMVDWLSKCASIVETAAELDGFMAHLQAVMRLYGLLAASLPDSSSSTAH